MNQNSDKKETSQNTQDIIFSEDDYEKVIQKLKDAGLFEEYVLTVLDTLADKEELDIYRTEDTKSTKGKEKELTIKLDKIINDSEVIIPKNELGIIATPNNSTENYSEGKSFNGIFPTCRTGIKGSSPFFASIDIALFLSTFAKEYIKRVLKEKRSEYLVSNSFLKGSEAHLVLELASLANDIYEKKGHNKDVGKWEACKEDIEKKIGEKRIIWENEEGFKSCLYKKTQNGKTEYAYVIKGTKMTNVNDWLEDIAIIRNKEDVKYSNIAAENAKIIAGAIDNSKLTFVGHSLGGAIASMCAKRLNEDAKGIVCEAKRLLGKYKYNAITFNPLTHYVGNKSYIESFILYNDFVNIIQDLIGINADGQRHYISNNDNVYTSHKIKTVMEKLANHKALFPR